VENLFKDQFIKDLNKRHDLWDLEPVKGKISKEKKISIRMAAYALALGRLGEAHSKLGLFP